MRSQKIVGGFQKLKFETKIWCPVPEQVFRVATRARNQENPRMSGN